MVFSGNIASGGEGLFWLIVVIFVIIAQIKKAMQKGQTPPGENPPSGFPGEPADELREFLRKLSEGQAETPSQTSTPGQRAAQQEPLPPPLPRHRTQPPSRVRMQPARHKPMRTQQPARDYGRHETAASRESARRRQLQPTHPAAEQVFVQAPVAVERAEPVYSQRQYMEKAAVETPKLNKLDYLSGGMAGRAALRRAIILREILGPPLAMRKMASHAFIG